MKRTIIALGLVAFAFTACQKQLVEEPLSQPAKQTGFNPDYEDIKPLILAFKDAAELSNFGNLKTTSLPDKTIEEAEWTLEGALNYDHAHPVQLYEGMHIDTLTITVNNAGTNSNGETMVDGDDLAQAYANLLAAINNQVPTGEDVDVVDVQAVSHNNYFTTFKAYINSGQPLTLVPDYVKPDDDWKAGLDLGKCDGTRIGEDAATRLTDIMNFNIANGFIINLVNPSQVLFYTNVTVLTNQQFPYQVSPTDPVDIRKWWGMPLDIAGNQGANNACNMCLDDGDMTLYYNQVWSDVQAPLAVFPQQIGGFQKDIINVFVKSRAVGAYPINWQPTDRGWHYLQSASYGVPVW